jgi:hypothetical protein
MDASTEGQGLTVTSTKAGWRDYGSGRRALIAVGIVVMASGLYVSWGWLAAVGLAPILVAVAPCAAMCALGLCMNRMGRDSCSTNSQTKGDRNE